MIEQSKASTFVKTNIIVEKIKILHIIEALGGGVYSYFTDLSYVMGEDDRLDVYIAYSNKRKEIDPESVRADFHPNCKLILLDLVKEISPLKDYQGYLEIKKTIKEINPHTVHLHSSKAGILGRLAMLSFKQIPSFYTPHGYAFLREDVSYLKKFLFKSLEHAFTKYTNTTTIACGDTELKYAKHFEKKPLLIRNGIRTGQIIKKPQNITSKLLTVGTLGRISYQKNPSVFNKYATATKELQYLWIGDGDMREVLSSDNIQITGWFTNRKEALPYLNQLDIYLQVSLWEGLPIAMIEAMAMGLPVISSNVIGNNDLVVDGVTGFLVENTEQYLKALSVLSDRDKRIVMGNAGRKRILKHFDCEKNLKRLVDYYVCPYSNKG